jgi:hypothetical protein
MFEANNITPTNVSVLLKNWFLFGLIGLSGLQCKTCVKEPEPTSTKPCLNVLSVLEFPEARHPPHLYFNVKVGNISGTDGAQSFMASIAWPFLLKVGTQLYVLHSRGYWNGEHYWYKVLCNSAGVLGLWLHNDMENDGYANLLSPDLSEIGGAERHTQWVFYLRMWNDEEKVYVDEKIIQIQKEHLRAPGQVPFVKLKQILRYLPAKCTKVGLDDIPDGESSESDVEMVAGDVAVVPKTSTWL